MCTAANIEEKCWDSGLHVDLAKKTQTTQLKVVFASNVLRALMEGGKYYVDDTVSSFAPAVTSRTPGAVRRREWIWISVLDTKMLNNVHFDQRGGTWVDGKLARQRSRKQKIYSVAREKGMLSC